MQGDYFGLAYVPFPRECASKTHARRRRSPLRTRNAHTFEQAQAQQRVTQEENERLAVEIQDCRIIIKVAARLNERPTCSTTSG